MADEYTVTCYPNVRTDYIDDTLLRHEFVASAETQERLDYERANCIKAQHVPTLVAPENAAWMMAKMRNRIAEKIVVEIGAGIGILAVEMSRHARRVFAIESDPVWTGVFSRSLYRIRSPNITWIFDTAENVLESGLATAFHADIAVVATGSDEQGLRALAEQFVSSQDRVIMPWQDWNHGRALINYNGLVPPCEHPSESTFASDSPIDSIVIPT